jgi:hypothetical protein
MSISYDPSNLALTHITSILTSEIGEAVDTPDTFHALAASLCVLDGMVEDITLNDDVHTSKEIEMQLKDIVERYALTRDASLLDDEVQKVVRAAKSLAYRTLIES